MSEQARDYSYTQERELSWLRFNERVMEEAQDESVPLFERLKFAAIFTSNLDEFFMIRVGSIYDMTLVKQAHIDSKSGLTPEQQQAIQKLEERMEALSRRNAILRRRLLRAFPEMRSTRYELALERMREALRKKKK